MNNDWRSIVPPHLIQPSECADYLDARVSEMSPKEWRMLKAAMEMVPQDDLAGVIALTESLGIFSYYFPAADQDEAGYLLAKYNYGVRDDVMPFIEPSEVFMEYQSLNGGVLVDGAFVSGCSPLGVNHIEAKAESIRNGVMPVDDNWSAKLLIEGPSGDQVWIRLPDYEEVNGGEQDEIATALMEVDAESLDECTLLEAKCIFPQIDLMQYDGDLKKLAFDASNLGYALFDQDHRVEHFGEKLKNALEYEQCDDINFAIDIIGNIDCYDFVPDSDLRTGTWNEDLMYKVVYRTNLKDNWTLLQDNLITSVNHKLDCSPQVLDLASNEYVTEFKFLFGTVKPGFQEIKQPIVTCRVLADLPSEYTFTNRTDVGGKYGGKWIYDRDSWTTVVFNTPEERGKLPKTGAWI